MMYICRYVTDDKNKGCAFIGYDFCCGFIVLSYFLQTLSKEVSFEFFC